jgi:hypothetical protein
MDMYTIYCKPLDYPDNYVVRKFHVTEGAVSLTDEIHVCETLTEAQNVIPYGLVPVPRSPQDSPSIVETWI